jgi:hypothetical protein
MKPHASNVNNGKQTDKLLWYNLILWIQMSLIGQIRHIWGHFKMGVFLKSKI